MNGTIHISELAAPPDELLGLVLESERDGYRLLRRLLDEWSAGTNRFSRPGEALLGAYVDARLVGVCGINVDPYTTDASTARARHLYVARDSRLRGIGRQLVEQVILRSRGAFKRIRVRTDTAGGSAFYLRLGFRQCLDATASHVLDLEAPSGVL